MKSSLVIIYRFQTQTSLEPESAQTTSKPVLHQSMRIMTTRSRELRNNMTNAEQHLWKHLRRNQLGVKFRRQDPIGRYIPDFVCHNPRIIIEVDGGQHHNNPNDTIRDEWLSSQGYTILRFWNNEILKETPAVLEKIRAVLETLKPTQE
jgi:very-short-patch-repair endonuclease